MSGQCQLGKVSSAHSAVTPRAYTRRLRVARASRALGGPSRRLVAARRAALRRPVSLVAFVLRILFEARDATRQPRPGGASAGLARNLLRIVGAYAWRRQRRVRESGALHRMQPFDRRAEARAARAAGAARRSGQPSAVGGRRRPNVGVLALGGVGFGEDLLARGRLIGRELAPQIDEDLAALRGVYHVVALLEQAAFAVRGRVHC